MTRRSRVGHGEDADDAAAHDAADRYLRGRRGSVLEAYPGKGGRGSERQACEQTRHPIAEVSSDQHHHRDDQRRQARLHREVHGPRSVQKSRVPASLPQIGAMTLPAGSSNCAAIAEVSDLPSALSAMLRITLCEPATVPSALKRRKWNLAV